MGWWVHLSSYWRAINFPDSVKTTRSSSVAIAANTFKREWKQFVKFIFQTQFSSFRPEIVFFHLTIQAWLAASHRITFSQQFAQVESNRIVSCLNSYIQVSFFGASSVMQIQYFPLCTKCYPFKNCLYTSLLLAKLHQLKIHSQSGIRNSPLWVLNFIRAHMHTKNSPVQKAFIWLRLHGAILSSIFIDYCQGRDR